MIERYTRPEMGSIWTDQNKFSIWLEIEILVCEALAEYDIIPKEAAKTIREKADFDVQRILDIEEETKHDVIAFLTNVEEYVGEPSRYIHLGLTSSDLLDTCTAVQLKQAGELLLKDMENLKEALAKRAKEFKYTVCIGRSHGIHAEPTTFGLKILLWHQECVRNIERMKAALENIKYGKISGAVGTYEHLPPQIEEIVCNRLGLKPDSISTQIVQRDRHAQFLTTIGIIGSMLEKIATEIRHLQRTEVQEAEEYFSKGQKGSSAMPHKRNPIGSENISGQARLLRSNALAAIENNVLWHERDISHSSVERVILPDSTISLDYILARTANLVKNLVVYPENMKKNLELTNGLIFSQKVLLALAKKGLKRQESYSLVQKSAMETYNKKIPFFETVQDNEEIMKYLKIEEIKGLFNYDNLMKNVDIIFDRCGV